MSTAAVMSPADELSAVVRPRYVIGSASDELVEVIVSGQPYKFRPNTPLEILDRQTYPVDKNNQPIMTEPTFTPKGGDSYSIVRTIFLDEPGFKGGERGLFVIRDDGRDEERYAIARRKYVEARCTRARERQDKWTELLKRQKPGSIPLQMSKDLKEDIVFLRRHESGIIDRAAYISWRGDFEHDDRAKVVEYVKLMYPAEYAERGDECIVSRDAIVPNVQAPPPSTRPAPVVEAPPAPAAAPVDVADHEEMDFLLEQAAEYKYNVSGPQLRGLMRNDRAVVESLMGILTELAAKARIEKGEV